MEIDIQEKPNDCPKECEICGHPFDVNNRHFIIKNKIGITIYICEDCIRHIIRSICKNCKHECKDGAEYPCSICGYNRQSEFEWKKGGAENDRR